jgi:exodeoxyribonuclease-3
MIKIISFNVNGIRASVGKGLTKSLSELDADIYCFQETKATAEQVAEALSYVKGYHIFAYSADRKGYSGTAILSKQKPLSVVYGMGISEHDNEGRLITAEFEKFYLVNVYVPNSGAELVRLDYRKEWDKALLVYIKNLEKSKPVIFCGDLNVAHQPIDIKNAKANYNKSSGYTQIEIDGMDNYIKSGFTDSFRKLYPDTVKYSWWSFRAGARSRNIGWRIDYILLSNSIAEKIQDSFIINEVLGSDHCPVGINIDL